MSTTSSSFGFSNVFATSRNLRVEDFLVKDKYVERRDAINTALRRYDMAVKFGDWKPVVKKAADKVAAPVIKKENLVEGQHTFNLGKVVCGEAQPLHKVWADLTRMGIMPKPEVVKIHKRGTGGGEASRYVKGAKASEFVIWGKGTSKKAVNRRATLYVENRRERLSANKTHKNGIGVGYVGNHAVPAYKAENNIAAMCAGDSITFKYIEPWMTAQYTHTVWDSLRNDIVSRHRKAHKAIRRAANRAAFTLEAVYNLFGYKASLTVGKQAVVKTRQEFKSVGAAAYEAPVTQQNKVKQKGIQHGGEMQALYDYLVKQTIKAGAEYSGFIRVVDKPMTGPLVVALCFIEETASGKVISNLMPLSNVTCIQKKDDYMTREYTPGMSWCRGLGFSGSQAKEDTNARLSEFTANAIRVADMWRWRKQLNDGYEYATEEFASAVWNSHYLTYYKDGQVIDISQCDKHLVLNLPGSQQAGEGAPSSDITTPRVFCKDALYTGQEEMDWDMEGFMSENPGFLVDIESPLNNLMAKNEGFYYKGQKTGVHMALVIAEVNVVNGQHNIQLWQQNGQADEFGHVKANAGQARLFCDNMTFFYLPDDTWMNLFTAAPAGNYNQLQTQNWIAYPGPDCDTSKVRLMSLNGKLKKAAGNIYSTYLKECSPPLGDLTMSITPVVTAMSAATVTKAEAMTHPVAKETPTAPLELNTSNVAKELNTLYAAKAAALRGEPVKSIDWKAVIDHKMAFVKQLGANVDAAKFGTKYQKAAIAVAVVAGSMTRICNGRVLCKGFDWQREHLETLVNVASHIGGSAYVETAQDGIFYPFKEYFQVKDCAGGFELWVDREPMFRFVDRLVLDINRDRVFHHTIELGYLNPAEKKITFKAADSFSNFMHFFISGVMPLMAGYFNTDKLPANFKANIIKLMDSMPSIAMSKDKWQEANGASQLLISETWRPMIASKVEWMDKAAGAPFKLGRGAADLINIHHGFDQFNVYIENDKEVKAGLKDMNTEALEGIVKTLYLESHFTKAVYLPFGAVNVQLVKQHCPTIYAAAKAMLDGKVTSVNTALIIVLTLKDTKALKRITLWMAQSIMPANGVGMGFTIRGQKVRGFGSAVTMCLAPSFAAPPGQNYWVSDKPLPTGYNPHTETNYKLTDYVMGPDGHPFDFSVSTVEGMANMKWDLVNDGGYTYLQVPEGQLVFLDSNQPLMFTVNDTSSNFEAGDVRHMDDNDGWLQWIRFKEEQSVSKNAEDKNLVIDYKFISVEGTPKIRSFSKAQIIKCGADMLFNELNPSMVGKPVDMIATQDASKLDVTYGMLMLASNTVNYNVRNGSQSPKIARMLNLIVQINNTVGAPTDLNDPVLVIDETLLTMMPAVYKPLLDYFEQQFVHPEGVWFNWDRAAAQTKINWIYYSNVVAAGNMGWVKVDNAEFPELAATLKAHEDLIIYREEGELTYKTNVLAFIKRKNSSTPHRYKQRTYVLVGDADCPLVNVELYESSTVQEAVSNSQAHLPTIVALSQAIANPELAMEVQREILEGGRPGMLNFAALAYADCNAMVKDMDTITVHNVNGSLVIMPEDRAKLEERLTRYNIPTCAYTERGTGYFKQICRAFADLGISLPKSSWVDNSIGGDFDDGWDCWDGDDSGSWDEEATHVAAVNTETNYLLWLPALYSFSKQTSGNEGNQDFVSIFFKEILKPLLRGEAIEAKTSQRCYYTMRSLINSEDMVKLPGGKKNVTAKRVALGDIFPGEVHVLESNRAKSPYQKARRAGFPVKDAKTKSVFGYASREPIATSYVFQLVIRRNETVIENGVETVKQFIYRPDGNGGTIRTKAFYILTDTQIGCDVFMPTAYDRGDFDGDGGYLTYIANQDVCKNVWDDGVKILNKDLEHSLFDAKTKSYFPDHYAIKPYAKAMKIAGSGILTSIESSVLDIDKHIAQAKAALHVQHGAVGIAYAVYIIGMIVTNLCAFYAKKGYTTSGVLKALTFKEAFDLVGLVCNMYEVMLGGYDKGPDAYRTEILDIITTKVFNAVAYETPVTPAQVLYNQTVEQNLATVKTVMEMLETKTSSSDKVAAIIDLTASYYSLGKSYVKPACVDPLGDTDTVALASFIFELGRGRFIGFKGVGRPDLCASTDKKVAAKARAQQQCAETAFTLSRWSSETEGYKWHNENIIYYVLKLVDETLGNVITKTPQEIKSIRWADSDCQLLVDACDDAIDVDSTDVDDTEEDNGGSPITPSDNDGDDGGTAAEVETIETEEVMTQETITADSTQESAEPTGATAEIVFYQADLVKQLNNSDGYIVEWLLDGTTYYSYISDVESSGYWSTDDYHPSSTNDLGVVPCFALNEADFPKDILEGAKEGWYRLYVGGYKVVDLAQEQAAKSTTQSSTLTFADEKDDEDDEVVMVGGGGTTQSAPPQPAMEVTNETVTLLEQLRSVYGGEISLNQLLLMVNGNQQHKDNKQDEVLEKTVPMKEEIKQIVIEAPAPAAEEKMVSQQYYTGVGSRETPAEVLQVMHDLAVKMNEIGLTLRSGHAKGADQAFESRANAFDVYLPKNGFLGRYAGTNGSKRYVDAQQIPNYVQAKQILKETLDPNHFSRLNGFSLQAHTRNVYQVLGDDLNTPSEVLYCWTEKGAEVGGTATAIKLAKRYGVKVVNLGDPKTLARVKAQLAPKTDTVEATAIVQTVAAIAAPGEGSVVKSEANNITEPEPIAPTVATAQPITAPSAPVTTTTTQTAPTAQPTQQAPKPHAISEAKLSKITALIEQLTDEQKVAFASICNDQRNAFLTGKGGAGKSFLVDILRKCYDLAGFPYIIVGSTGTSVVNVDGHNTFNGMFGLGMGFEDNEDKKSITRTEEQWSKLANDCRNGKYFKKQLPHLKDKMTKTGRPLLVILDEVSQSDSLLLSAVECALTDKMNVKHQWLLVGDPMQFEPVKGNHFFKDVEVIAADGSKVTKQSIFNKPELNFTGFNLKDNMRAKGDKVWSEALDVIRMHHIQDDLPEIVKQRWEHSKNNPAPVDALIIAPTNKTVNRFNKLATQKLLASGAHHKEYVGVIDTKVRVEGLPVDYWLYDKKSDRHHDDTIFPPIRKHLTLCKGMRVMMRTANLKDKVGDMLVNNGQTGTVLFLGDSYVKVKFDNGVTEDVKRVTLEDPEKRGSMDQIPLVPAYAITINKTQGMTFNAPCIFHMYSENRNGTITPIGMDNAFYVALSRLTTSENCWFHTEKSSIDWDTKAELTPYETLKKSFKTNNESLNFVYKLK